MSMFSRKKNNARALAKRRTLVSGDVERYRARPSRDPHDEFPSEDDIERFSDVTVTCPHCGADNYDDASLCWSCSEPIWVDRPKSRHAPAWVIVVTVVLILALLAWVI